MAYPVSQANGFQGLSGSIPPASGILRIPQGQFYVRKRTLARQQIKALEHKSDFLIANLGQLVIFKVRDALPIQDVLAGGWPVQAADNVHQGRLARSRGSHDRDHFASLNFKREPAQGMYLYISHLIDFGQICCFDNPIGHTNHLRQMAEVLPG